MPRIKDINLLDPKFKPYAERILEIIEEHNLPFRLFETLRTLERQKKLKKRGSSWTLKSQHIKGLAADFVVYHKATKKYSWKSEDILYYDFLGKLVEKEMGDKIKWGGRFKSKSGKSRYDGAHFQLKRSLS